jgi:uroporphyrinogen-III synthase
MKVVVTRPPDQAEPLVQRLEQQGHEVTVCPLIEIEPVGPEQVDLSGYDWVVVTSANAARELGRRAVGKAARVAAIGPGTAAALSEQPDLVPVVSTQEGLLAELPRPAGRVLFAGAEGARKLLVEELDADFVPLYRTKELVPDESPEADVVVLASPSAARAFAAIGRRVPAVSIGPETTAAAERAGVEILREARTHDLEGLVSAVTG